jgi:hypothetical protein
MLVQCSNCSVLVDANEVGSYTDTNPYDPMDSEKFILCKCPQCSSPILTRQRYTYAYGEVVLSIPTVLYPNNEFRINPIIPETLKIALIESIKCYQADAFTATVIMCRRTLEGFVEIKGIKEKNLDKSIQRLRDNSIINEQLFEWANELRLSGNEAAHNINASFTNIDAKDILDFTIAILDFTFSFKEKFDAFKKRSEERRKSIL